MLFVIPKKVLGDYLLRSEEWCPVCNQRGLVGAVCHIQSVMVTPLGIGYWVLNTGYLVLGTGQWVLGTGHWAMGTGYWVMDTGHWTLDTEQWVLGTTQSQLDPTELMLVSFLICQLWIPHTRCYCQSATREYMTVPLR